MAHEQNIDPQADVAKKGISDLSRRLRVLEERYTSLRRKGQLAEENMLQSMGELKEELDKTSREATELRRLIIDIDDKLDRFLEQVKQAAPREEVLIIKKYLDMWDPVRYLTREEAKRVIDKASRKL